MCVFFQVYADAVSGRLHNNGVMNAITNREKIATYEIDNGRITVQKESGTWQATSVRPWERSLHIDRC